MLLEAGGDDFDESIHVLVKLQLYMSDLTDHVKTSQDLQSVKSWVSFLRKRNLHLDCRDEGGFTPLMFAALSPIKRSVATVRLLLACGADVSLSNDSGKQALHLALLLHEGHIPKFTEGNEVVNAEWHEDLVGVVTCLIEAGADIFALDNDGMTPIDYAWFSGKFLPFADALERFGLSVEDVREESFRRTNQWETDRRRLHGAKRTAVDAEILQTPSTEGLHQRRRQICQAGDDD
jgi:hypothetical protein